MFTRRWITMGNTSMTNYPNRAGATDTATSRKAADAVEARGKESREKMLYTMLAERPRSRGQLCEALGLPVEVVGPRLSEMKSRGLLQATGETVTGKYGLEHDVLKVIAPYSPIRRRQKKIAEDTTLVSAVKLLAEVVVTFGGNNLAYGEHATIDRCREFLRKHR